ncbi:polysaccharide pyruvyl transferase CsaB [Candidatus Saganbacteria bacterium]|nr:polysaccharide pyruvyl transferase CsaB [Candidatus Saganbacteria bacterium]
MKIAVSGYYGFGNTGDEAILESLRQNIKGELLILDAKNRFNFKMIWDCDIFISGGGGLLQDKTSTRSFLYYLGLIKLAKMLGKKVFVFAASIGPVNKPYNRFLLKRVLNQVDVITVRDLHSFNFAKSLHFNNPRVVETADPAFLLTPISAIPRLNAAAPLIGVCIREMKSVHNLAKTLDQFAKEVKARVVIIPFQPERDLGPSRKLKEHLLVPAEIVEDKLSPREMLGMISQMDLLVGMRLHSLIFAVSSLVPAMGLSYDPKVASFLDEVSLPYLSAEVINPGELLLLIRQLWDNQAGVKLSLQDARRKLYGKAQLNFGMIDMLKGV